MSLARPPHPCHKVHSHMPGGCKHSCRPGCQIVAVRPEGGRKQLPIGLPDCGSPSSSSEVAAAMELAAASTAEMAVSARAQAAPLATMAQCELATVAVLGARQRCWWRCWGRAAGRDRGEAAAASSSPPARQQRRRGPVPWLNARSSQRVFRFPERMGA